MEDEEALKFEPMQMAVIQVEYQYISEQWIYPDSITTRLNALGKEGYEVVCSLMRPQNPQDTNSSALHFTAILQRKTIS